MECAGTARARFGKGVFGTQAILGVDMLNQILRGHAGLLPAQEQGDAGRLAQSLRVLQHLGGNVAMDHPCAYTCTEDGLNGQIDGAGLRRNGTSATALVQRARACIEKHAGDEGFSVSRMAGELHMSRASLHRKLVASVGMAPGDYIRRVRLDMARKMLFECEDSVSCVAYAVGFETLSGFSRAYSAYFGIAPSRNRRQAD